MVTKTIGGYTMHNYVLNPNIPHQRYFEDMTRIPHGSYHEQAYSDYLVRFAEDHGLRYRQYDSGSVIIYKPAAPGYEDHTPVMLQAHIDMVWEKTPESTHDFEKDPLTLVIRDGQLWADGTTLGADDGAGVAYMLSILENASLPHPPLECVFTVREEADMAGAFSVQAEDIAARRMIGLDDMGGGKTTYITSAGGADGTLSLRFPVQAPDAPCYQLQIDGLLGGHSGVYIDSELGNAIKCAVRILAALREVSPLCLASLKSGLHDNVIPRDCEAVFATSLPPAQVRQIVREVTVSLQKELRSSDPDLSVSLHKASCASTLTESDSATLLDLLYLFPHGRRHKSMELPGLITASENLAAVDLHDGEFSLLYSVRAMFESHLDMLENEIRILAGLFGCDHRIGDRYPSWEYSEHSPIRELLQELIRNHTGEELTLLPVHGGLECGVFSRMHPDMEIVTLGPLMYDVHTPDEHLDLQSFDEIYDLLLEMLKRL